MSMEISIEDLAREWWAIHGPGGTIEGIESWSNAENDAASEIDRSVEMLSNQRESLGALVAALVGAAPTLESLALVGTFVLEDVRALSATEVSKVVKQVTITNDEREAVLSGYRPAQNSD